MIERYLLELEGLLPATGRRRVLREAREHLRDAAAAFEAVGLDRASAEARAVGEFGSARTVASAFAAEAAVHATRRASVVVAASVAALVVPLYGIPENVLPPAPWTEKPTHLAVQQSVVVSAYAIVVCLALAGALLSLTRRVGRAAALLATAALGAVLIVLIGIALAVQWKLAAPETPLADLLALMVPATALPLIGAGAAAWWAVERHPALAGE